MSGSSAHRPEEPVGRILLVEDNALAAAAKAAVLERAGHETLRAASGEEALRLLGPGGERVDLVLMDIDLGKGMDGIAAAELLLARRSIPVVFFSANSEHGVVERASRLSSYGFIPKSAGPAVMASAVGTALRLHRALEDRRAAEEELRAAYREKSVLLRELQHRVKNSMGIIAGLVSLEAERAPEGESRAVLKSLESRVTSLGALYDLLSRSAEVEAVRLDEYLEAVAEGLRASYSLAQRGIVLETGLAPMRIDVKRAVALGIIANELLTDAIKHAFPEGRSGTAGLRLEGHGAEFELLVHDDGIGLPADFDPARSGGLGMSIVASLVADLGGSLEIGGEGGARFSMRFPLGGKPAA